MTEDQLRTAERALEQAGPAQAAALAFAAIVRMGQLGTDAGTAFGNLAARAHTSFLAADFNAGCGQIEPWAGGELPFG